MTPGERGSEAGRWRRDMKDPVAVRRSASAKRKIWATPQVHRFGSFVEVTLKPRVKTVLGSDSFCLSPVQANSPDRIGCASVS